MHYVKVAWNHTHMDEPVLLYSECDDAGWETRKIEVFRDGRLGYASRSESTGDTRLGIEPLPNREAIAAQPEFRPALITRDEFERLWQAAQPVAA